MRYRHIFAAALLGLGALGCHADAPVAPGAESFYQRACSMYDTGNYAGAIDQLGRYLEISVPQLSGSVSAREHADLLMIRARLMRGEFRQVRLAVSRFCRLYSGSPLVPLASLAVAESCFYEGRYGDAVNIYGELPVGTFEPAVRSRAQFHYAVSLCECGYFDRARSRFLALADDPEYGDRADFYVAYVDYVEGDYDSALRRFLTLDHDVADSMGADFYVSQIYFSHGDYDKVLASEQRLLRAAGKIDGKSLPAVAESWRLIGESAYHTGDQDRAEEALRRYVSLHTQAAKPSARYILGVLAYGQGRYAEAEEWLSPVTAEDSSLGQSASLYMGQSAARRGDYTSAAMSFDKAAHQPFDSAVAETALYNYAAAVACGGRVPFGSASSLLEEFGTRYPDSGYAAAVDEYLALGYLAEKRYLKALDKLDRIKNPSSAVRDLTRQVLYDLGAGELAAGQAAQAEYYLRRAVSAGGGDEVAVQSRLWLAESLYAQKKYADAATAYRQYLGSASRADRNRGQAGYNMGYALYHAGDYKGCRQALEAALRVSGPGALPASLRSDARLRMADCDNYLGNVKAALAAYQEAASDTDGGSPDYAALQAACMRGILGDEAGKRVALEAMMARWPSSPWMQQALYELSQACLATGDFKGAEQAQSRLSSLAPGSRMLRESKLQMAVRYAESGQEAAATDLYKQVISSWPSSAQAVSASEYLQTYYSGKGQLGEFLAFLSSVPGAPQPEAGEMDRLTYVDAISALERNAADPGPLEGYIARYPEGRYKPDALLALAQVYLDTRNSDKALVALDSILVGFAHSDAAMPALLMKAGMMETRDKAYAEDLYRELLQRGGASYAPQAYEGLMKTSADPHEAVGYADRYLGLGSLDEEERFNANMLKADALLAAGRGVEALELLRTLGADTSTARGGAAAVKMARVYLQNGDALEAERLMTAFTDNGCDDLDQLALGYITLSDAYAARGDKRRARQYLESLSENYPGDNPEIKTMIANGLKNLR